jgi:EmrB/QacA subfamily drug resistance transporter
MGRLGDIWGLRKVYIGGFALFGAGSVACAAAPTLTWLVLARVLQASGAAMFFATGPALVTKTFPPQRRGWALGWLSLAVSGGLTLGPSLGGLLLGIFGWPSIFLINVPLVIIVMWAATRLLPHDCPVPEPFDIAGALLAGSAFASLLLGLSEIDRRGLFSAFVLGSWALAAILGTAFVWWQRQAKHPMVDLRLFDSRPFSRAAASAVLAYMSLFAVTFVMPFYLLQVRGVEPVVAGLMLTATPVAMALLSPPAGRRSDRTGSRLLTTAGLAWLALTLAVGMMLSLDTPQWAVVVWLFSVGAGLAVFGAPNTAGILKATPSNRVGIGSALVGQARSAGMAMGIAVTAAIVSTMLGGEALPEGVLDAVEAEAFLAALRPALGVASAVALLGALVSWSRGDDRPGRLESGRDTPVDSRETPAGETDD